MKHLEGGSVRKFCRSDLMDNAVALASWSSIWDGAGAKDEEIINMHVSKPKLHNNLPCGSPGEGLGDHFQSAEHWNLPLDRLLYNGKIRHNSK